MSCSCGRNARARLYCHRSDCGQLSAVELPPADVDTSYATNRDPSAPSGSIDIVISRRGSDGQSPKAHTYRAEGATEVERVADAVRKVLSNPATAEDIARS